MKIDSETAEKLLQDPKTLPTSIAHLVNKLEETLPTKASEIVQIIKHSNIEKDDLMPYSDFEHSNEDSYGRRMVYHGSHFEIMVMSWKKGDFSAIHDHGHTMWGAVKLFGKAEHATFRWEDENISTLARWVVNDGDVIGVGHSLVHQMGNHDSEPLVSLHVYGHTQSLENITGESRIFDLDTTNIQRVNGGAFFNLKENQIVKLEEGPKADFPTLLRYQLETYKRQVKASDPTAEEMYEKAFDVKKSTSLLHHLRGIINEDTNQVNNSIQWKILKRELKEAANVKSLHDKNLNSDDRFNKYAEVYDELIGRESLNMFMESYIRFFSKEFDFDFKENYTLSIGCGTGMVEQRIKESYDCKEENIYGIDISESMIEVAKSRINADVGDLLDLDPVVRKWDLAYSGLNVFQYLPNQRLEEAIKKSSDIIHDDGYFLGDFITPDHIRWYPNVMYGSDHKVISLRTPQLIEIDGASFQESEILNIHFLEDKMDVHYAGKHRRFLAPMFRIRSYFEKYFKEVHLFDAISLSPLARSADSCTSTRYIVIAKK